MKGFYSHPRSVIILSHRHGVFLIPYSGYFRRGEHALAWRSQSRDWYFIFAEPNEYSLNYRRTFLNKMIMELKSLRF